MTGSQPGFERRVHGALDAVPSRIPVVLGGCGTGRTWLLQRLRERNGRGSAPGSTALGSAALGSTALGSTALGHTVLGNTAQYIDVERCATTPERFLQAVITASPFPRPQQGAPGADKTPATAREAFDALLAFFDTARGPGGEPVTFLLDEVLELRTFESFPGLRHVLRDLLHGLAESPNRFVLTTRYVARAHRLLRDAAPRFEVMHLPPLSAADVMELLAPSFNNYEQMPTDDRDFLARAVQALADGRAAYVRALGEAMADMGAADPISALTALLSADGRLTSWCRFCYELRLHRARGYGALKAILDILAEDEPLTLTEISLRLRRTPGSTKDYLSWLEDVDLVTSRQKRYSFTDPLLRLWVRLNCHSTPPTEDDVVREVQRYALARVPQPEPTPALAYAGIDPTPEERKSWGIIEID
jgi:hypothetical protein